MEQYSLQPVVRLHACSGHAIHLSQGHIARDAGSALSRGVLELSESIEQPEPTIKHGHTVINREQGFLLL